MFFHPLFGAPPLALIRSVARHGGVRFSRLPLLVLLVVVSFLRLPGIQFERWRLHRLQRGPDTTPAPIFIVGHWRSGTSLLHNLLSSDPGFVSPTLFEAVSPVEFIGGLFMPVIRRTLSATLPAQRPMDTIPVSVDMPMEEDLALATLGSPSFFNCFFFPKNLGDVFEKNVMAAADDDWEAGRQRHLLWFCRKLVTVHPGRRLLLKSPTNSTRILALKKLFPGAKFIHIHRHPDDVFASTCRLYQSLVPMWSLQSFDAEDFAPHIARTYPGFMQRLLDEAGQLPDGDLTTLSLQELTDAPLQAVAKIYARLGLSMSPEAVAAMTHYLAANPIVKTANTNLAASDTPAKAFPNRQDWSEISKRLGYR